MNTIKLSNNEDFNVTVVSNEFIDQYMIHANGEFVKVYLFILRYMQSNELSLTISDIADALNNTEGDIIRALSYWESEDILHIKNNKDGISEIIFGKAKEVSSNKEASSISEKKIAKEEKNTKEVKENVNKFTRPANKTKELKSLLFIAEQYLGRTLTRTDIDIITYFYDDLDMPADLIEYLIESCVENNHNSMHYIKAVGINWFENNIKTADQAKRETVGYGKNSYKIMRALGINNRGPATSEEALIKKWLSEYGFSMELIIEACNRTIAATHQPSFEYVDSILSKWKERDVKHLKDLIPLDNAHKANKEKKLDNTYNAKPSSVTKTDNRNNFKSRDYDMDSLEKQLLGSN